MVLLIAFFGIVPLSYFDAQSTRRSYPAMEGYLLPDSGPAQLPQSQGARTGIDSRSSLDEIKCGIAVVHVASCTCGVLTREQA